MLDAHRMNVFLTAAETLNFTEAARLLNMSQPAVSQHIQSLEQHFNTPLFVRSGRQLSLTDAGRALLPMARQLVRVSVRIDETMESLQGEVHGQLHVGCSTTAGKYVLPFLLAHFLQKHPKVQADCRGMSRHLAVQDLCDGKVHIALASPDEFSRPDLECRLFFTDPVVLIAPPDHQWAARGDIEAHELLDGAFILRDEDSCTYQVMQRGLHQLGLSVEDLHCVLTLGNSEAVALAVREGLGVGFVSRLVARQLVSEGVTVVPVRGLSLKQGIYVGQNTRLQATRAQAAFWQFVTDPDNPILRHLSEARVADSLLAEPVS